MEKIKLLQDERIKYVEDFEGRFMITDFGRLFSINGRCKGIKELHPAIGEGRYYATNLRIHPRNRTVRIHQLVGEHFVDNPDNKPQLNHIDGNKLNNHYLNLEWVTSKENIQHAVRTGLMNFKGENHHNSKYTEKQVIHVHVLRKKGLSHQSISNITGIGRRYIGDLLNGTTWPHISSSGIK